MRSRQTKIRTTALRVLPVAAAAAAVALAVPATPAAAQPAPAETTRTQAAFSAVPDPVGYHFTGYYSRLVDCQNRGNDGVSRNEWEGYICINGSWFPGDDYELWVRFW
ncbi:hypothetical protein [Streptomyces phaeochromogenes]|uniref:hypothetical protein n=1 Tax=Streptomyces phaeochromogenes TaxID=1923 RepID=UPI0037235E01